MCFILSYEFMESRVKSLKADQEALQEKLRINDEYTASIQEKMKQLFNNRAAWHKRYVPTITMYGNTS